MARVKGSFATSEVPGTRFADVRWVAETGSTNRDLLEEAARGVPEGVVLVADHQTAGRGRLDRTWVAPAGASLLVSVLLRPDLPPEDLFLLTVACALAAADGVERVTGFRPGLKWPNDLVVAEGPLADRKLAGILAESHVVAGSVDAVVVGMGLNLDWPDELPAELAATAASVNHLTGGPVDREAVLVAWLTSYDRRLASLATTEGRAALLDDARNSSVTIGRLVRVERADGSFEGRAMGITEHGHLLVDHESQIVEVTVGDVVHARLMP